jgi:hypothetical protein
MREIVKRSFFRSDLMHAYIYISPNRFIFLGMDVHFDLEFVFFIELGNSVWDTEIHLFSKVSCVH